MILYVNVRHSGTGFVFHKLFKGMLVTDTHGVIQSPSEPWEAVWEHVTEETYDIIRRMLPLARGAFTTFRTGVDESHVKRGESLWMLERDRALLVRLMSEFDILPLHLEIPARRDEELAEINRRCGTTMHTDWARVESMSNEVPFLKTHPDKITQIGHQPK